MKKINKIFIGLFGFIILSGLTYATLTVASTNKSTYIPWQGTPSTFYDPAHNVGLSGLADTRFTDNGDGTIFDNVTNLTWQSDGTSQGPILWTDALIYCDNLELGSEIDWRLPNIKELSSTIDYSKNNPSIDTTYFSSTISYYRSKTTSKLSSGEARSVVYENGQVRKRPMEFASYVRCVSNG